MPTTPNVQPFVPRSSGTRLLAALLYLRRKPLRSAAVSAGSTSRGRGNFSTVRISSETN